MTISNAQTIGVVLSLISFFCGLPMLVATKKWKEITATQSRWVTGGDSCTCRYDSTTCDTGFVCPRLDEENCQNVTPAYNSCCTSTEVNELCSDTQFPYDSLPYSETYFFNGCGTEKKECMCHWEDHRCACVCQGLQDKKCGRRLYTMQWCEPE